MRSAAVLALGLGLALALALTAGRALADDDLARARRLEASLEYEQALAIVEGALDRGGADPARLVELHLLAGRLAAGLDRAAAAEDHFARVLALRPETALPPGTSPKLTAPFAAARARSTPLEVHATAVGGLVALVASRDALGLVSGIAVHVIDAAGAHRDLAERGATRLAIPPGTTAIEAAALDARGNRLWVGAPSAPAAAARPPAPPPPPPAAPGARPLLARPQTWAVAAGVALAGGGLSAWRFVVAQHEWDRLHDGGMTDFTDLSQIEQRGRRWGLAANLGFGIGGAAALASGFLWLRARGEPSAIVAPGPGAGAALQLKF